MDVVREHPTAPNDRLLTTLEHLLAIQAVTVEPAFNEASDLLHETLGVEKIDVFLHDPTVDTLVAIGTSNTPMGRRQHALGLDRQPVSNGGRAVETYRTGQSYRTGHAEEDAVELVGVKQELGVRSTIAAALDVEGRRRGVLVAQSAQPDRFTERDLPFLEAVARWIGLLVHLGEMAEHATAQAAEEGRRMGAEELVTVLAHDLRNHLTPLMGRINLIRRRAERERQPSQLRDAKEAAQELSRLAHLIDDLLDAARLEQGLFQVALQPVDLAELARETAAILQTPNAPIHVRAPEELIAIVDPDRVRQALENLLANAATHSPDGVAVTVEVAAQTAQEGEQALLTVADQGDGIAPELLSRLFTRFAAGSRSNGLGLGLYLAHEIARVHGGDLTVNSRVGAGARFTLLLPTQPATRPPAAMPGGLPPTDGRPQHAPDATITAQTAAEG